MKKIKNIKGLVLAEALLAIAMLSISVVVTASIIQSSLKTTLLSKNYLIAQNLVTEGIEAVKGIRDTNWLKNPSDPSCWLKTNTTLDCIDADTAEEEEGISYLAKNASGVWTLEKTTINLDLETLAENTAATFRLNYFNVGNPSIQTFSHENGDASPYYRSVKFIHISPLDATFNVKVQWKEGQKVRSVVRSVTIFNYF